MPMYCVVVYSAMPSDPPSRPSPDCLTPPNGRGRVGDDAGVEAHHAELDLLGHAQQPVEVAAVDVGGEAVFAGVGQPDGVLLGGERGDGGDGAEDFLARGSRRRSGRWPARWAGRSSPDPSTGAPPVTAVAPASTAALTRACTSSRAPASISGPTWVAGSVPRPVVRAPMAAANFAVNSAATDSWTRKRLAAVQASPMFRIFAAMAPSTALSRSASSNTMNGALPPSSMEVRSTFCAASAMRRLPTGVEPVKETFRSRGVLQERAGDPGGAGGGDDVQDAGGQAGVEHGLREQLGGQRA